MELNKFEQDVKQKMEQRTIQPTEMAWDRLDAMLSVTETKPEKKKSSRSWMYMAACFLGLLMVGTFFLNQEKQNARNTDKNSVVTTDKQPEAVKEVSPIKISIEISDEQEAVATATPTEPSVKNGERTAKASKPVVQITHSVNGFDIEVEEGDPILSQSTENEPVIVKPAVTPSKIKVDPGSLLASVDSKSVNKTAVSNPVVITPDAKQPSVKVNPNSLLSSVEGELNESFRSKVLNTVSKNYNKVKTSVASRNRE